MNSLPLTMATSFVKSSKPRAKRTLSAADPNTLQPPSKRASQNNVTVGQENTCANYASLPLKELRKFPSERNWPPSERSCYRYGSRAAQVKQLEKDDKSRLGLCKYPRDPVDLSDVVRLLFPCYLALTCNDIIAGCRQIEERGQCRLRGPDCTRAKAHAETTKPSALRNKSCYGEAIQGPRSTSSWCG